MSDTLQLKVIQQRRKEAVNILHKLLKDEIPSIEEIQTLILCIEDNADMCNVINYIGEEFVKEMHRKRINLN